MVLEWTIDWEKYMFCEKWTFIQSWLNNVCLESFNVVVQGFSNIRVSIRSAKTSWIVYCLIRRCYCNEFLQNGLKVFPFLLYDFWRWLLISNSFLLFTWSKRPRLFLKDFITFQKTWETISITQLSWYMQNSIKRQSKCRIWAQVSSLVY